ncbi:nitroreductase [Cupriavidus pauculus]|uniref:Nitroreductase n=1 Tax=Cupriavidus pauculus TaxID=82633 RepID=A0A2N5CDY7_9BURK|nr:nitroreductase [Cupriavidus pauculus]PLQ00450.1 nitroreductase [Cupriavidus pauculus]
MTPTSNEWSQDAIAQCVASVVSSRRSVRAFTPESLGRHTVEAILADAASAPSGANIQPWRVYVVTGHVKDELTRTLVAAYRDGIAPAPAHFPEPLPSTFRTRLMDFGARYYASLGIDRNDTPARMRQTEQNFSFFGAPVGLILSIDRRLMPHSWIDLGLFAQNLMIAAKARGIDTCPQVAFAPFHEQIASHLHMPADEVTAFGIAMGYADPQAKVNQLEMPRERVQSFARLMGFPTAPSA